MSEMPASVQQAIDIVEDECFLNDFSPVEKTKSRKILWRVGNIIRDRIKASAAARCSAVSAASMRGALEKIATRKVIRYGGYLRCHTCGYKSVAPHTEERHAPNCARQLALAALSDPVLTEPQTAPPQEEWVEVTDGTTLPGDRFSYIGNSETGVGQITSHKRRRSQAVNVNFIAPVGTCAICKKPPAADCAICASIALTRPQCEGK